MVTLKQIKEFRTLVGTDRATIHQANQYLMQTNGKVPPAVAKFNREHPIT